MELKKLVLKNFRAHKRFTTDFKSGISAIIGENGTGKSSLVEAIIFLFTGEGYGFKTDLLTVGESSGYVLGHVDIAGKEAVLERHLDSSKVSLKYDGTVYKKSSEVAELWEKLFQIDKNIFKNVIVAQQGDIPLLFSGDNSTKEKIFQKIFMVPNTGKLRDLIWDKYVKTAPPEYPLLDEYELTNKIAQLEADVQASEASLLEIPSKLDSLRTQAINRAAYLNQCVNAQASREKCVQEIKLLNSKKQSFLEKIAKVTAKLNSINIFEITEAYNLLKANKPHYEKRQALEQQLKNLEVNRELFEQEDLELLQNYENEFKELEVKASLNLKEIESLQGQIHEYQLKGLTGKNNCPTCGSTLENLAQYLEHIESKIVRERQVLAGNQSKIVVLNPEIEKLRAKKLKAAHYSNSVKELVDKLDDFDQSAYDLYKAVIEQHQKLTVELAQIEKEDSANSAVLLQQKMELISLPEYDHLTPDMFVEQTQVAENIKMYDSQANLKVNLLQHLAATRKELELTTQSKERNNQLRQKNILRKNYVNLLQEAYELLATSQFPRKLIQTYTDTVSSYLVENLRKFNFPYEVRVNGSFGIDVYDDKERLLPSVSGGQEIMIGIALRLALHNMFGSAFPMLILDEGSVHLSQESRKSYFQIVQELKKDSNFKQIIIIDHDEELSSVVDNTIKLT
jgi:exonuclease SbcC